MLIHINGMPGVGKLTVAKILAETLPAHLVDNHALINAAYAAGYDHNAPEMRSVLHDITERVYLALAENKTIKDLIFTNALASELSEDQDRFERVAQLASARQEPIVPVLMTCDFSENAKRVVLPGRAEKKKLTNTDVLKGFYDVYTILHPEENPYALHIDTTYLKPAETAEKIREHVKDLGLLCKPPGCDPKPR